MHPEDQFSNLACIECALKVSTSYNFLQFCEENQKLLRSQHFHVDLLVEATDHPQSQTPDQVATSTVSNNVTQSQSQSPESTRIQSPPNDTVQQNQTKRRRSATPTLATPVAAPTISPAETTPNEGHTNPAVEDLEPHMALSSMLECQLDDADEVDDEEQAPKNVDLPVPLEGGLPPSNPYKCTVCFREFAKKANVLSHFQTQHTSLEVPSAWKYEIEPAKCPLCGELVECLLAHLEFHAQRRTFKCDQCEWAFYSKNYLNIHVNKLHKADAVVDAKPDRFACKLCAPVGSKQCQNYDDLVAHYRQWHLNEMKSKVETCTVCGKETRYLKQHMEKAHNSDSSTKQFACHLCGKTYLKQRYLLAHLSTTHKDQQPPGLMPPPPLMDYSAAAKPNQQPGSQAKKPRTQQGPPVHCVKCQMQFPNNRMLNMHIQRYHNANIHGHSPPVMHPTTTAEMSVTAIPANVGHMGINGMAGEPPKGAANNKRRRDSVPAAFAGHGHPKDLWNNSALTGMLVNMFGMHGHYED